MHKKNNPDWPQAFRDFLYLVPSPTFRKRQISSSTCQLVYLSTSKIKKSFFYFLPSHPHKCGSNALFIGVSRVRVSVRAKILLSPPSYPLHSAETPCLSEFQGVRVSVRDCIPYKQGVISFPTLARYSAPCGGFSLPRRTSC